MCMSMCICVSTRHDLEGGNNLTLVPLTMLTYRMLSSHYRTTTMRAKSQQDLEKKHGGTAPNPKLAIRRRIWATTGPAGRRDWSERGRGKSPSSKAPPRSCPWLAAIFS